MCSRWQIGKGKYPKVEPHRKLKVKKGLPCLFSARLNPQSLEEGGLTGAERKGRTIGGSEHA